MLVTKRVSIRWNGNNRKYYESKGYVFTSHNDYFLVDIEDVTKGSEVIVEVQCDYCEKVYEKTFYHYNRHKKESIITKDSCVHCRRHKIKEVFNSKYSVNNPMDIESVRDKVAETMVERYGENRYAKTREWKEKFSGSSSPNWQGGLTDKVRKLRNSTEQKDWKQLVFQRDGFVCAKCQNPKNNYLNAHHIYNFAEHLDIINDIDNGVTLCSECHTTFHKEYGYKNNNQQQIDNFLNKLQ